MNEKGKDSDLWGIDYCNHSPKTGATNKFFVNLFPIELFLNFSYSNIRRIWSIFLRTVAYHAAEMFVRTYSEELLNVPPPTGLNEELSLTEDVSDAQTMFDSAVKADDAYGVLSDETIGTYKKTAIFEPQS
ncbi:hypothetical protein PHYBLDRAFT_175318 [Phycomyces blakesleeanus NRRL 1555(-)]|uniref:Uncharacterized protein n=1 Tax=Phycomyces blakesleeanus (strain ATCC 8743b / DSM 1359 / FGSC 10004 / NBRC 33097 / NRRL 1555) TaxID=763407 RepID=A0A162N6N5_PHYB8|nr:hypothetical protein PHYBLDRAFT_175318 [Phycomyces blakesleeanus NRRL 1555(-)]OAD66264.1 hypothetical protein PHYBLDRAFT_175318 [Phycomyces blakesleeanus NRRL 1555(-)]|eukprot:XP_018284304.1 hypothetical protein PHYBLDRAFT_175318 [Phycomyces blakesleeanus NRRL 1555(-)]